MVEKKQTRRGPLQDGIIAKVIYAKVNFDALDTLGCTDLDTGMNFAITGAQLIEQFISAGNFTKVEHVTQTDLAERLTSAAYFPFTVCFVKADGTERTLRGRLLEHEDLMGRSMVWDFDVAGGDRFRQVDHRTLRWLIIKGVKYELKAKGRR